MTIDINQLRVEKGGDPENVRRMEQRRCRDGLIVDEVVKLDNEWRESLYQMEQVKKRQNAIAKEIGAKKKSGGGNADVSELMAESTELKKKLPELEKQQSAILLKRDTALRKIGNFVHESCISSRDEAENQVLRAWKEDRTHNIICDGTPGHLAHYEILARLEGYNLQKAGDIAGHRAYYLKGYGFMLNQALVQYGSSFLRKRGYVNVQPPFFMKRDWMTKTAELADFEETLYCIPNEVGSTTRDDKEDMFMIATSEQPLCALHAGEYLDKELPLKYAGFSTCFRKEAGSHGKDMRGIFRVHQFEKVEQFIVCSPQDSWQFHDEMIKCSEEFYQSLEIPYRVVSIVAGALNDAAARKYDLEAWFPSYGDWRELVSCSNCTDFQSRDLNIRFGTPKMGEREKPYVHMLNGTLCATERTMCCLIEHYQTPEGIKVPEVLRPYMDGLEFLPYKV